MPTPTVTDSDEPMDIDLAKDEIYRLILRVEFGAAGSEDQLAATLSKHWDAASGPRADSLRKLLVQVTPAALALLRSAKTNLPPDFLM